jgi:hypothetical protein
LSDLDGLLYFVANDQNNTLFQLIVVHQFAKGLCDGNSAPTIYSADGGDSNDVIVNGVHMSLEIIQDTISNLENTVLLGLTSLMGYPLHCGYIVDTMTDNIGLNTKGVSLLSQNETKFRSIQSEFMTSYLQWNLGLIQGQDSDHKMVFNPRLATAFYLKAQSIFEHLTILIHLVYGLPARGTELMETKLMNNSSLRNVFLVGKQIAISLTMNKRDAVTNSESRITRFLTVAVSEMLIRYLIFIRPLEM